MYTIFLQALGRYIDLKSELRQQDPMFDYAKQSLLHYAGWMVENEYVYLTKPEKLEYPNETWAVQELRKCQVLCTAARYAKGRHNVGFVQQTRHFLSRRLVSLRKFETGTLTRPVVLALLTRYRKVNHDGKSEEPDGISAKATAT